MENIVISIGSDHAGFLFKEDLIAFLVKSGYVVIDKGTKNLNSVDYPDYAHEVAHDVENKIARFGILICGSGNGVCMSANKHQSIRAALCWKESLGALARQHNDANVLCLPARFISKQMARKIVKIFLASDFEGGRHEQRVKKISC